MHGTDLGARQPRDIIRPKLLPGQMGRDLTGAGQLTVKALGFLQSTGLFAPGTALGGVFSNPSPFCKIRSRYSRELKFSGLIAYIMFYKICHFESPTITNDVIMTCLPKTMAKFRPPRNKTKYISFERY